MEREAKVAKNGEQISADNHTIQFSVTLNPSGYFRFVIFSCHWLLT